MLEQNMDISKFSRCVKRAKWTKNKNKLFVSETPLFETFRESFKYETNPFLATALALFITPVWAQKSASTDKDYICLNNACGASIKSNSEDASRKRVVNYFAKDKTAFLSCERISCSFPVGLISKLTTISEYENFDLLIEEFSFLIENFKMNHQSELNNLNMKVRLRYENSILESKYPDFRAVAKDIEGFF